MKVKENAKKVVEATKKMKIKIARMMKFFSTLIGKIVLAIIAILILLLLIYIIASVIVKSLGKLLGIDAWVQTGSDGYDFLKQLNQSGYTSMLNAKELIEYHSFEYAVLMDAARYMEENGADAFDAGDKTNEVNFDDMSIEDWAKFNAQSFSSNVKNWEGAEKNKGGDEQKGGEQKGGEQKGGEQKGGEQKGGEQKGDEQKGGEQKGDEQKGDDKKDKGPKQFGKNDLVFYSVYNEYTKEYSLVPYLEIVNAHDVLTYYFEHINDESFTKKGSNAFEDPKKFRRFNTFRKFKFNGRCSNC